MLAKLKLHRAVIGGQFVVSTTQKGIDDFRGGGAKLSADPGFVAARKQAGMPDQTTGFAYANVKDVAAAPRARRREAARRPAADPQRHRLRRPNRT